MFNNGDEVIVRTTQEMIDDGCIVEERRYGSGGNYIVKPGHQYAFVKDMEIYCGQRFRIRTTKEFGTHTIHNLIDDLGEHVDFTWEDFMLKPAEEKLFDVASESDIIGLYD